MTAPPPKDGETSIVEAAERMGVSPLTLRIFFATGCPGSLIDYTIKSQADLAAALGVSRRTVGDWIKRGMPRKGDRYSVAEIIEWRRFEPSLSDNDKWITGHPDLPDRNATGDLARATLRMYSRNIPRVLGEGMATAVHVLAEAQADEEVIELVDFVLKCVATKCVDELCLDEVEIRKTMTDAWMLV